MEENAQRGFLFREEVTGNCVQQEVLPEFLLKVWFVRVQVVNSNTFHTACTDAHTLSAHHIALIPCTTSVAHGQPGCVPKIVVSFHLSCAISHATHGTRSTSSSSFSSVPGLQGLLTFRNPCADSREHGCDGYTG